MNNKQTGLCVLKSGLMSGLHQGRNFGEILKPEEARCSCTLIIL
jgi:hypothetical protein